MKVTVKRIEFNEIISGTQVANQTNYDSGHGIHLEFLTIDDAGIPRNVQHQLTQEELDEIQAIRRKIETRLEAKK